MPCSYFDDSCKSDRFIFEDFVQYDYHTVEFPAAVADLDAGLAEMAVNKEKESQDHILVE